MSLIYPVGVIGSGGAVVAPSYQVERSLRFNSQDTARLSRASMPTRTSTTKFTTSFWIKRSLMVAASGSIIFSCYDGSSTHDGRIIFNPNGTLHVQTGGSTPNGVDTVSVFRDYSAWMHVVVSYDTVAPFILIYVNGVLQPTTGTVSSLPHQFMWPNANNRIGNVWGDFAGSYMLDGYLTELYWIDGQALPPSAFAQTNPTTGQWEPIAYAGAYGNTGFYLKFADNSNTTAATLGKDSSPNGLNWTPNNFSVAAGVGNDSLRDTPTNGGVDTGVGGECTGNYATMNPLDGTLLLANGNLQMAGPVQFAWHSMRSTIAMPSSGNWWLEVDVLSAGTNYVSLGFSDISLVRPGYPGAVAGSFGYMCNGDRWVNGVVTTAWGPAYAAGDRVGFWMVNNEVWCYKQTASTGAWVFIGGMALATGLNGNYAFCHGFYDGFSTYVNFGQRPWATTLPSAAAAAKAWCTQNLSDPAIVKPSQYFDVLTYSGNGVASRQIPMTFRGDLWISKSRNLLQNHAVVDSARASQWLATNSTNGDAGMGGVGFYDTGVVAPPVGGGPPVDMWNDSGNNYVGWVWKKGITPGLDVVLYTGTAPTVQNIPHSLNVKPTFVICKTRSAVGDWWVYHQGMGNATYQRLNANAPAGTDANIWASTTPTSLVFTVGSNGAANSLGTTYVSYMFADVPGFSKFGTYTGNATVNGPFVWCGFRPKWILLKHVSSAYGWLIYDSARNPSNVANLYLLPSLTNAEASNADELLDIVSNGFKIRGAVSGNQSGAYIFAAFAESPFKYARAEKSPTPTGAVSNPPATSFQVLGPATAVNGVAFNFTVQARAAGANTTNYTGTIHFTSTAGGATLPANTTLVSGIGTFSATFPSAGTFTITATDTVTGSIVGTSGNIVSAAVTPGSQTLTTVGANNFTVPAFNTLSIELFAGGGGAGADFGGAAGAGGTTTVASLGLSAGGGPGGNNYNGGGPVAPNSGGGGASGGSTNLSGAGSSGRSGGAAANGGPGTGGTCSGTSSSSGGGGGGYCALTFTPASLTAGTVLTIVVGGGGAAASGGSPGTAGGNGKAVITWS